MDRPAQDSSTHAAAQMSATGDRAGEKGRHQWRRFLVPGTYDPITRGHLDIITRASGMCDEVVVAVAESPEKRGGPAFNLEHRVHMAKEATSHLPNVSVQSYKGLTVAFAQELGVTAIVKGLRAITDFEYELQQANLNYHLAPEIHAVFVMADHNLSYVSSTAVRELASLGADVSDLVTPNVEKELFKLYGPRTWPRPVDSATLG